MAKTKLKTLRLQERTIKEIKKMSIKENRNFNNMVETILQKVIKYPDLVLSLK